MRTVADAGALDLAKDIGLAPARRARAGAPEFFQREVAFLAVAPHQREFLADHFGANGLERSCIGHEEKLATVPDRRYNINS